MHSITFVFDIDDTLGLHFSPENWERETAEVIEVYGKDFLDRHTIQAIGYPHFIFPGIPTL